MEKYEGDASSSSTSSRRLLVNPGGGAVASICLCASGAALATTSYVLPPDETYKDDDIKLWEISNEYIESTRKNVASQRPAQLKVTSQIQPSSQNLTASGVNL